mmetsp:Transcript_39157/g.91836  ORF Transcript_39157/g.91836 Transcript_39157/m.91836 type:complete len:301 (+) Transcript_39157:2020-2922(+)
MGAGVSSPWHAWHWARISYCRSGTKSPKSVSARPTFAGPWPRSSSSRAAWNRLAASWSGAPGVMRCPAYICVRSSKTSCCGRSTCPRASTASLLWWRSRWTRHRRWPASVRRLSSACLKAWAACCDSIPVPWTRPAGSASSGLRCCCLAWGWRQPMPAWNNCAVSVPGRSSCSTDKTWACPSRWGCPASRTRRRGWTISSPPAKTPFTRPSGGGAIRWCWRRLPSAEPVAQAPCSRFNTAAHSVGVTGVIDKRLPRSSTRMDASSGASRISLRGSSRVVSTQRTSTCTQRGDSCLALASK